MKVSDFIIDFLVAQKVSHVFEVCGGALAHLLDSLYGRRDIKTVSVHHEQAAAIAAEGFARVKGDVGVALATSGPGATNLITGIASCYFDSIPAVFITGQVNTYEFKFNRPVRQIGFQETDIVSIVKPVVKDAVLVDDPSMIRYHLERAFFLARSGRPGPVLLDIPMNVQRAQVDASFLKKFVPPRSPKNRYPITKKTKEGVIQKIKDARRPVVLAGGGVVLSKATHELALFVRKTGMPVVSSLLGLDAFDQNDPHFVGMIGTYGNRGANLTVACSDLLLCLGTRLDTRQTGTKPETFARRAVKIHVDIDPSELNNKVKVDFPVAADIREFLACLDAELKELPEERLSAWRQKVRRFKALSCSSKKLASEKIDPNDLMELLSGYLPDKAVICTDIGQNQIWAAQSLALKKGQRFLTQGGMGSMGSSLPMAIGAALAHPAATVVSISGDGGFQLNMQELQTIVHHRLNVKIILLNNGCYGMVRQFQKQYFKSRFQSTQIGYSCPNFLSVVSAYNIPAFRAYGTSQLKKCFAKLFAASGPCFCEVALPREAEVSPKLSVGQPIENQDPPLTPSERKMLNE